MFKHGWLLTNGSPNTLLGPKIPGTISIKFYIQSHAESHTLPSVSPLNIKSLLVQFFHLFAWFCFSICTIHPFVWSPFVFSFKVKCPLILFLQRVHFPLESLHSYSKTELPAPHITGHCLLLKCLLHWHVTCIIHPPFSRLFLIL